MQRFSLGFVATGLALAAMTQTSATATAATPQSGLYAITCELRAEMDALEVGAEILLADSRDYRDVTRELEDMCRDLDRLERELLRPIRNRHQLNRLGHLAHKVDDEACDLLEEIREAVRWMERRRGHDHRHTGSRERQIVQLPLRQPSRRGGVTLQLGGGSSRVAINLGGRPIARKVGRQVVYAPAVALAPRVSLHDLQCGASRIRGLTQQLVEILCHD